MKMKEEDEEKNVNEVDEENNIGKEDEICVDERY